MGHRPRPLGVRLAATSMGKLTNLQSSGSTPGFKKYLKNRARARSPSPAPLALRTCPGLGTVFLCMISREQRVSVFVISLITLRL